MSALAHLNDLTSDILSRVIKLSISPLIITDNKQPDNPIIYANQAFLDLCGYKHEEVVGHNCRFLQGKDSDKEVVAQLRKAVQTEQPVRVVLKNYRKDGTPFWNDLTVSPIINDEGEVTHFLGMQLDITERERVQKQIKLAVKEANAVQEQAESLERQKKHLIALNQAKDDFISLSSHQLRTPATNVKQYLGMLLEGYAGEIPEQIRVFLRTAYDSNERQLSIINDLLKTAQLDSGRYELHKELVDMRQIITDVVSDHMSVIIMRQQHITRSDNGEALVHVDPAEIKLALTNLLENASKYSHEGGRITIKLGSNSKYVRVSIKDDGVGIAKENLHKIFDRFTRVDNELSDTVNGSGLGLYFVKRIVKLHGGKIEVKSTPGEGSSFSVVLPI